MITQTTENQEVTQEQVSNHEAEMIAKVEAAEANSLAKDSEQFGADTEGQQLLAGKYKTPEDLEKAYKELEAKLGKQHEETPKEEAEEQPKVETKEEAEELVSKANLDFSELNAEYAEAGELSQETYDKLAKAGIDKNTVDAYIAGQEALAQQNITKLQNSIGGEQNFNDMVSWAAENLSEAEKVSFNKMVSDEATAEFAIKGLYARYSAEAEPRLLDGQPSIGNNRGYQSHREMTRDMADPRYKVDPAYRKQVEMKIARSKF